MRLSLLPYTYLCAWKLLKGMTKTEKFEVGLLPEDKQITAVVFDYHYPMCDERASAVDVFSCSRYTTTTCLALYQVRPRLVRSSPRERKGNFLSVFVKKLDCPRSDA